MRSRDRIITFTQMESDVLLDNPLLELDVKPLTLGNSNSLETIIQSSFHHKTTPIDHDSSITTASVNNGDLNDAFGNSTSSLQLGGYVFPPRTNPTFMYHHHPIENGGTVSALQTLPSVSMFATGSIPKLNLKHEVAASPPTPPLPVSQQHHVHSSSIVATDQSDCKYKSDQSNASSLPITTTTTTPSTNATPKNKKASTTTSCDSSSSDCTMTCVICSDKASGKHYGVISCEGCKGFFKRTVRKQLTYVCRETGQCPVDRRKRTRCQHCRFEQCLAKGMRREAVQEERHRHGSSGFHSQNVTSSLVYTPSPQTDLSKQSLYRSVSSATHLNPSQPSTLSVASNRITITPTSSPSSTTTTTSTTDPTLLHRHDNTPMADDMHATDSTGVPILNLGTLLAAELSTDRTLTLSDNGESIYEDIPEVSQDDTHPLVIICQSVEQQLSRLVHWARQLPVFAQPYLNGDDQFCLIKAAWPELILISAAYHSTAVKDGILLSNGRHLGRQAAQLHGLGPLFDRILHELVDRFRDLALQRTELALLRAIILFNPDANGLSARHRVESVRENLYAALHSYCITNQPQDVSRFTKILLRLPPLRSISYKCLEHLVFVKLAAEDPTSRRLINLVEHGVWPVQDQAFYERRPDSWVPSTVNTGSSISSSSSSSSTTVTTTNHVFL